MRQERSAHALLRQHRRLVRGIGTMVGTWTTVPSCAQIGKNVRLSGVVGSRCKPARASSRTKFRRCGSGIVEKNSVASMGLFIGHSTK